MARRLGSFLLLVAAALLAVPAYWLLFTAFMIYDDAGYVLISLKNYSQQGGLYSQVYSQYGPFFYFFHDIGHRLLGYEFNPNTGRLITLCCWLLTVGACTHLVWRQTHAITFTGFTLGFTFFHLWQMISEPGHPGGLIITLVAIGAWLGAAQIERRALRALAVTAGLVSAALLLTKINVGVFFLTATGAWFAVQLCASAQARLVTWLAAAALVMLPLGLMQAQLGGESGRLFMGLSMTASLTMLAVAWRDRHPLTRWSHAIWGAGALLALGAIVVAAVCWRGTSLRELLDGVLLDPLRQPGVYHFDPAWKPGTAVVCGASLLLAGLVGRSQAAWLGWLLVGLRLVLTLGFGLACLELLPFSSHSITMSYMVPLAWIFALHLDPDKVNHPPGPASWLGLLLVLQYLHAYPVAGSQIGWGTFLIVPLMALGLHDAVRFAAQRGRSVLSAGIGLAGLALAIWAAGWLALLGWNRYTDGRPLRLPGAENVRLPENYASVLRLMALNGSAHGDLLFSLPGQFSFNLWTELPTPTLANTTHWFSLLSRRQQDEIAAALTRSERPVVITQRYLLEFLRENHFPVDGSLYDYLQQAFVCAFSIEQYEFWVRRGRSIAPLGTVEIYALKAPEPGVAPGKLELIVAIPSGRQIASIEVAPLAGPPRVLAHWDKTSGPLLATAINLQGEVLSTKTYSGWEQPLPPLTRLTLPLDPLQTFDRPKVIVYVRDAGGALLAEARFKD